MKYTTSVIIDLPRDEVIRLMDDPDNMQRWQPSLVKWEHLHGEPGQPGAKMKLHYDTGKRKMEMIETILDNNFPESFDATYEASGVHNLQHNTFEELDGQRTRWTTVSTFRFSGVMRVMSWVMRGAFPKQTARTMKQFKAFAESEAETDAEQTWPA